MVVRPVRLVSTPAPPKRDSKYGWYMIAKTTAETTAAVVSHLVNVDLEKQIAMMNDSIMNKEYSRAYAM